MRCHSSDLIFFSESKLEKNEMPFLMLKGSYQRNFSLNLITSKCVFILLCPSSVFLVKIPKA